MVVRDLARRRSSWRSEADLDAQLRAYGIPGIAGIDTRKLTRRIRDVGAIPGAFGPLDVTDEAALLAAAQAEPGTDGVDLVAQVTTPAPYRLADGQRPLVVAYDFGIKRTILRHLASWFDVEVVPASTTAADVLARQPAGVFLSNGPGDPAAVPYAVDAIGGLLGNVPVFGICLGHQLLGRALGADTVKLPFGHHGGNHPVRNLATGKVEITSQNHNFAVDADSLAGRAEMSHVNLNDGVCEGLRVLDAPAFSVQHHPEAGPGPHDSAYLFEDFAAMLGVTRSARGARPATPSPSGGWPECRRRDDLESILLIGAGPIVIGQACEFDYSGTQACKVLGQEGYRVILANSNPATIMTDPEFAAATYVEPLDVDILCRIIEREQPDAVLPTLGGQTALNLAMQLVERGAVGTRRHARADRRQRRGHPHRRGPRALQAGHAGDRPRRCRPSGVAHDDGRGRTRSIERIGLPVVIRPAFILGGKGTGIATTPERVRADGRATASPPARSARSSSSGRSPGGRSTSSRSCATARTTA